MPPNFHHPTALISVISLIGVVDSTHTMYLHILYFQNCTYIHTYNILREICSMCLNRRLKDVDSLINQPNSFLTQFASICFQ